MNSQWTKERNRLTVESIKSILLTQHNFKHMTCAKFHSEIWHLNVTNAGEMHPGKEKALKVITSTG